jgi:hypothetical protein
MAAERTPGIRKDPPPRVLQAGREPKIVAKTDWYASPAHPEKRGE